jgi:hypothetical protein
MIFTEIMERKRTCSSAGDEENTVSLLDKERKNKNGEKEIKKEMGMAC